jgi:hypothetical protein
MLLVTVVNNLLKAYELVRPPADAFIEQILGGT